MAYDEYLYCPECHELESWAFESGAIFEPGAPFGDPTDGDLQTDEESTTVQTDGGLTIVIPAKMRRKMEAEGRDVEALFRGVRLEEERDTEDQADADVHDDERLHDDSTTSHEQQE